MIARAGDAHRHPEPAGRSARRLHRRARHELARQRLRRRGHPRRDQQGRHRRPALPGGGPRHPLGAAAAEPGVPTNPLAGTVIRSAEEGARRRPRARRARAWTGSSCIPAARTRSAPTGEAQYVLTYPLPVLQAIIDETHRLGRKAACHAFGGEGLQNAITAGCDTIEHGYGLTQAQLDQMVAEGARLRSDARPLHRAVHGRQRRQEHRRQVPHDPDLREGGVDGRRHARACKIMVGSGADGSTFPHGTQALEFERLVKRAGMTPARGDPGRHDRQRRGDGLAGSRSARSPRASSPISSPCPATRSPTSPSCSA